MTQPTKTPTSSQIDPKEVHEVLSRYMLADGLPLVFDFAKSEGAWLFDARTGTKYLDLFSFFASQPLGFNHPRMKDEGFLKDLMQAAACKPTNSDIYTVQMASFVQTFAETCVPESHRSHLFFVEGGALAVENALKTAFDWKYRRNQEKGGPDEENLQILHFEKAFHGRTGYTLSLTNTSDPRKYQYFPRFDWPRVAVPAEVFPADDLDVRQKMTEEEDKVLADIRRHFDERPDLIAAILVETIQGEGGDNHFRPRFLEALRAIADERDALLIFDEVQCGMGLTGTWWAWQQLGVEPDIFCFGKKSQVCGIAANKRVDEIEENVFHVSSRINSTWGGNLVDMVRSEQYIRIIAEENLLENAAKIGNQVLTDLRNVAKGTGRISNVRGRGLMIAFDLADGRERDAVQKRLYDERQVIMLPCGDRSLRFRPVLDFSDADAQRAVKAIAAVL